MQSTCPSSSSRALNTHIKQDEANTKYSRLFTNKARAKLMEFITSMSSRLKFAILVSSYLSVLLISYLLGFFYPFFTPYGWLLIPVGASFFVGYLTREVETATKTIIACLSLHTGVVFALLNFSSVEKAFIALPIFVSYWAFHIVLGITASFAGVTFSELDRHIISMMVRLVKKIKQTTERLISRVRR